MHAEEPLDPLPLLHHGPLGPERPGTVTAASVLMWLHFGLACCLPASIGMVVLFRVSDVESGPIDSDEGRSIAILVGTVLICLVAFLTLVGVLAVKLLGGRRWARYAALALNVLVVLLLLVEGGPPLLTTPNIGLLVVGQETAIAACLCTPSARAWFASAKAADPLVAAWAAAEEDPLMPDPRPTTTTENG